MAVVETVTGSVDAGDLGRVLMHEHDISRLPVVADTGLVGIVARVDVLRTILADRDAEA